MSPYSSLVTTLEAQWNSPEHFPDSFVASSSGKRLVKGSRSSGSTTQANSAPYSQWVGKQNKQSAVMLRLTEKHRELFYGQLLKKSSTWPLEIRLMAILPAIQITVTIFYITDASAMCRIFSKPAMVCSLWLNTITLGTPIDYVAILQTHAGNSFLRCIALWYSPLQSTICVYYFHYHTNCKNRILQQVL